MTAAPYTITCDQAGCPATLSASTCATLERAAKAAGWLCGPGVDACPQHVTTQAGTHGP